MAVWDGPIHDEAGPIRQRIIDGKFLQRQILVPAYLLGFFICVPRPALIKFFGEFIQFDLRRIALFDAIFSFELLNKFIYTL